MISAARLLLTQLQASATYWQDKEADLYSAHCEKLASEVLNHGSHSFYTANTPLTVLQDVVWVQNNMNIYICKTVPCHYVGDVFDHTV